MVEVVDPGGATWGGTSGHRSPGVSFKDLFLGSGGVDNYWFALVKVEQYSTPPHRHNFDQVRYMLNGAFGFGDEIQKEGSVGYFTEGLTYTQRSIEPNVHLLLQCEGGSRQRFIGPDRLRLGAIDLARVGRFEQGAYISNEGAAAEQRIDGFEAVWTHIVGDKPVYNAPRYSRPLIMSPDAFTPVSAGEGAARSRLGRFTEREIEMGFLRVSANAQLEETAGATPLLVYVRRGAGTVSDEGRNLPWREGCAIRVPAAGRARIAAAQDSLLFYVRLPN